MISAIIVEDEEKNRLAIKNLIEKHCPMLEIVGLAANAEEAYRRINELKPQLVFLDIKMPGHSGFALLKKFKEITFEVIFITAYDKYAAHAFEFNAVDYILKPVSVTRLTAAVDRATDRIKSKTVQAPVIHFIHCLSDQDEVINKFQVHHNGKVVFLNTFDICSIVAQNETTVLNLRDKSHYYSSKRLHEFENVLENTSHFMRINKSVIINIQHIHGYSKGDTCIIDLEDGSNFEVSRRRKNEILQKLKEIKS